MIHIKPTFFLLTCESAASGLQAPNLKKKKNQEKSKKGPKCKYEVIQVAGCAAALGRAQIMFSWWQHGQSG